MSTFRHFVELDSIFNTIFVFLSIIKVFIIIRVYIHLYIRTSVHQYTYTLNCEFYKIRVHHITISPLISLAFCNNHFFEKFVLGKFTNVFGATNPIIGSGSDMMLAVD